MSRRSTLEPFFCFGSARTRVPTNVLRTYCDPMVTDACSSVAWKDIERAETGKPGAGRNCKYGVLCDPGAEN